MSVLLVSKDTWQVLRLPYSEKKNNMVKPVMNVQFTKSEFLKRKCRDFNMPMRPENDSESCGNLGSSTVSHCTIQNKPTKTIKGQYSIH